MADCPCIDCPDREIGCHGKCERYAEWSRKKTQDREQRASEYVNTFPESMKKWMKHEQMRKKGGRKK